MNIAAAMKNEVSKKVSKLIHRGRSYSLFQLRQDGDYFIKIQKGKIRKQRSLKTPFINDAKKSAKTLIDKILYSGESDWEAPTPPKTTLWRIFQRYRAIGSTHGLAVRTIEQNISELKKVVGREKDAKRIMLSELNDKTVRDFFDAELSTVDVRDETKRQKKLRSIRSTLRQARSVFKEDWIKRYVDGGMDIPDLTSFLKEKVEKPKDSPHQQVEDGTLEKIHKAANKIKQTDPVIYIMYLLAKTTLRRGEIQNARWDWIVHINGQPTFRIDENQKGKRKTDIPIDQTIYKELCEWRKQQTGDYILPENGWESQRCGYHCKSFDVWIRKAGLTTDHTFHEIRAWSLHEIREKYGLEVAQRIGRHTDSHTTEYHYTGEKKLPENFCFG